MLSTDAARTVSPGAPRTVSHADRWAVATLVSTGIATAWPLLAGGAASYVDNPVHLAEIHALAFESRRGWSDMAYCGLPLGHLHSPLWYGLLAALARIGVPILPAYTLALGLGFLAPALALYVVARRHLAAAAAALLAVLLLVQRTSVVGLGAALGGMWTFYLGVAFWILLVDRMAQPTKTTRDLCWIAALAGLVTTTHLFLVVPTALLGLVHVVAQLLATPALSRRRSAQRRALAWQALAGVLGVLAAAVYWGPHLQTRDGLTISGHTLSTGMVFARLLVPTRIVEILVGRFEMPPVRVLAEALPMWGPLGLGVVGALWSMRRGPYAARVGALSALLLLLLVTVGKSVFPFVTGPLSWRLLTVVQAALALAAIPALAAVARRVGAVVVPGARRVVAVVAMILSVATSALWNQSLRPVVPTAASPEMREVGAVWDWLRSHATDAWGRVYVQDTSFTEAAPARLRQSHVMARTAAEASVRQLGAAYSAVPFPTVRWTAAEFGNVFGVRLRNSEHLRRLREAAWRSNTTHLVVCDPQIAARLAGTGLYEPVFRAGTFSVLHDVESRSQWAVWVPSRPGSDARTSGDVHVESYETGRVGLRADVGINPGAVLVKVAYHPFWTLTSPEGSLPQETRVVPDDWGLLQITGLPPGRHELELAYVPPRWPLALTLAASLGVVILGVRRRTLPGKS